jgi:hypothetical protein
MQSLLIHMNVIFLSAPSIPNGCLHFVFNDRKCCVCYVSHLSGRLVITLTILGEVYNVQRPVVTPYTGVKYLYLFFRVISIFALYLESLGLF